MPGFRVPLNLPYLSVTILREVDLKAGYLGLAFSNLGSLIKLDFLSFSENLNQGNKILWKSLHFYVCHYLLANCYFITD